MRNWTALLIAVVLGAAVGVSRGQEAVRDTPHNLSASGPGAVKALSESEICIFCHTPHNASPTAPLWNRGNPGGNYTTYTSTTLNVAPGQPSGATRLCLSCHDGTIALGKVLSRRTEIAMTGDRQLPPGRSRLGLDLSDDHPVSLDYASSAEASGGELQESPEAEGRSLLDTQGLLQCTSCHDPHDNRNGEFLRVDPVDGKLCLTCHVHTGWTESSHATSSRSWNGPAGGPEPRPGMNTVASYACRACHVEHEAPGRQRLLLDDREEEVCYACHGAGDVTQHDIRQETTKWRAHNPANYQGVRDPAVEPDGEASHVECEDCHNPHRVNASTTTGSELPGALRGVSGLSSSGTFLDTASREYEICYKCHSSETASDLFRVTRVADQRSVRLRLDPGNPSYHPVEARGLNDFVPSLKDPYTVASQIRCTDCHSNDTTDGPRGPHGSRWEFLLRLQFDTGDPNTESVQAYALCYSCHERTSILNDDSFALHREHIVGENTSCSVCHASHGIDATLGTATNNSHLINFDAAVVTANSEGKLEFVDLGRLSGSCSLKCHNEEHLGETYGE